MLRRAALPALIAGAFLAAAGDAQASGAWISGGSLTPVEQRVAVAVGPSRTTLWTSLRFDAAGGPMAVVVPAAPGASLDLSSDAWLEALEVATAPRVFPPSNLNPFCPGKSGSPHLFELDGQVSHTQSLARQDVAVLPDVGALSTWAANANLTIPASVVQSLSKLSGVSFVAILFAAPPGPSVTPTIRISTPNGAPMLPLSLVRSAGTDLEVTAWLIGQGAPDLGGGVQVVVDGSKLAWNASTEASNYASLRADALSVGPDAFLVESAGHAALSDNVPIAQSTASIDAVVTTFFDRAAAYGDGAFDASSCIATATPLLGSNQMVAATCPRAALGAIAPAPTCTESPGADQVDPASLRCGPGADDLALALSGLAPASAWVTRQSMLIPEGAHGIDATLTFAPAMPMSPLLTAQSVDTTGCADGGAGSSSSSSSGMSSGSGSGSGSSSGSAGTSSGYTGGDTGFSVVVDTGDNVVDTVGDVGGCDCSGTSSTSGADAASSSSSCDGSSSDSSSSSCDGSSSDSSSSSCSGNSDSSSSSCSSGNSGSNDSCSSGSGSSDSCSGSGSSGADCGGGSDFKCTTAGPHRVRAPKMSILLMAALAVVAPLRRRGRRRGRTQANEALATRR